MDLKPSLANFPISEFLVKLYQYTKLSVIIALNKFIHWR
jgi:hypothetical protein